MTPRRHSRRSPPSLPALVGTVAGLLLLAAVFMPWYQTNLGALTSPGQASGWAATGVSKGIVALAVIWIFATVLAIADESGSVRVDRRTIEGLGYLVSLCALLAAGLVALRLARPPGANPDFLSRDYGLLVAGAACLLGLGAGVVMASRR